MMKISAVLRRAAEMLHDDHGVEFSCNAVNDLENTYAYNGPACLYYKSLLSPRKDGLLLISHFEHQRNYEFARHHRIIALLLAADVAQSEGL